jgi:ankyrin repeat protein
VHFLIEKGASTTAENESGFQPWACAAIEGYQGLMRILKDYADTELEEKAKEDTSNTDNIPNSSDKAKDDDTGLSAKELPHLRVNEEPAPGAPEQRPPLPLQNTAMIKAIEAGNVPFVRNLIGMGVKLNEPIDGDKRTALSMASAHESTDVIKLLIHHGARVDVRGKFGNM